MPTPIDFMIAKVRGFQTGNANSKKSDHISKHTMIEVNGIIEDIKKQFPETAPHLPKPITANGRGSHLLPIADITFAELDMNLSSIVNILEVCKNG